MSPPVEPLGRSSLEAYVGLAAAVIVSVFPMSWGLKCLFVVVFLGVVIDVCWRSPYTVNWSAWRKVLVAACVAIATVWVSSGPIKEQYVLDQRQAGAVKLTASAPSILPPTTLVTSPTPSAIPTPATQPTTAQSKSSATISRRPIATKVQHNEGSSGINVMADGNVTVQATPPPKFTWSQAPTEPLWGGDVPNVVLVTVTTDRQAINPQVSIRCDVPIEKWQFNIGRLGSSSSDIPTNDNRAIEFLIMSPAITPAFPLTIYIGSKEPLKVLSVVIR